MNHRRSGSGEPGDDALAALVRAAGPRPMPPGEHMARARERVHAEWRASVASQRRGRWQLLAAAASVVLAAGVGYFLWSRPQPTLQVAVANRVSGDVKMLHKGSGRAVALRSHARLGVGETINTASTGRVLLTFNDSVEVRIDRDSKIQLDSATALRLLAGALYVDTRANSDATAGLAILTSAGVVRHVGTRFEVRVVGTDTHVRVRDGTALFTGTDHAVILIASGQQLSVADGRASVVEGPGAADPAWDWTHAISPTFEIEGRSLYDSVAWLGREAGLTILYANDDVLARAQEVRVHGSVDGLATREALVAVLTGSGFQFDVETGQVRIRAPGAR